MAPLSDTPGSGRSADDPGIGTRTPATESRAGIRPPRLLERLEPTWSAVGFGAFKIGRNTATKYERAYELPDDATVERFLNGVLDLGITYIDTAPAYGASEERIGRTLAHRRREFIVSTKAGESFENGTSRYDFSAAAIRASVETSLRRLRTDVLDLVFLHATREDLRVLQQTDAVTTLLALRDAGLVRGIGLSGYTPEACRASLVWADALMVEYHVDDRRIEGVMNEARARGVAVVVKKALASGRLPPRAALSFVLRNPAVTSVAVGSLSLDNLRDNLRIAQEARPAETSEA